MSYVVRPVSPRARLLRAVVLYSILGGFIAAAPFAHAGPTWDGTGGNDLWSTAGNWTGDALPPNDGTVDLVFDGILRTSPDMDAAWSVDSLGFAPTANAFTLGSTSGFTLTVGSGGIANQSLHTQVIDTAVALAAPQTWTALARLSLEKGVSLGAHQLMIDGVQSVRFGAVVGGAGSIVKNGTGTLILDGSASNTFAGGVTVNSGTFFLNKSNARAMTAGVLQIGDGLGGADADVAVFASSNQLTQNVALDIRGSGLLVGSNAFNVTGAISMTGGRIATPFLQVLGNVTTHASPTPALIGTGTLDFFGTGRTFTVADGAAATDLDVAATLTNGAVIKNGPGQMRITGANAIALGLILSDGTLVLGQGASAGTGTLTLAGGTLRPDAAPLTIANPVGINLSSTIETTAPVTLVGVIAGTAPLRKTGDATLTIGGATSNPHSGVMTVAAGTFVVAKTAPAFALSGGLLVVGDGAGADAAVFGASNQFAPGTGLDVRSSGIVFGHHRFNVLDSLRMTGGTVVDPWLRVIGNVTTSASASTATIGAGTIDFFSSTSTWNVADGAAAIDLDVAAGLVNGAVVKTGPGALRLTSAGTFDGGFTLGAGTLLLAHDNALGAATFTFAGGTLRGDSGPRTLANAVHLTGPATVDGTGSLTLNGVISGPFHVIKNGPGTLTIGGATSNTNSNGMTITAGTVVFAKASPAVAAGVGTIVVGDGAGTDALVLAGTNQLPIGSMLDVRSSGVVYGNNLFNVITSLTLSGGTIDQGNIRTTGTVLVASSTNGSRLNGGTLDFSGSVRTFNIADGAAPIDLDVSALVRSNGGINKTGPGAMRLTNVNQGTLGTTVNAGTLVLAHPAAAGAGSFAISAGGSAVVQSGLPAALRIVGVPSIALPGKLDLTDNDAVIDYSGASPQAALRMMLQTGAIVTTSGTPGGIGIGYADATDLFSTFPANFSGQSIDDTTLLLRFTRIGDANLDGTVNLQDFNRLAANFGAGDVWFEGDFNYDGSVTLQDFNLLAANFGLSAAGPVVTPDEWAALASAVPEPSVVGVLLFVAGALGRRHRRGGRTGKRGVGAP